MKKKYFVLILLLFSFFISSAENEKLAVVEFKGTLKNIGGDWYLNTGEDFFKLNLPPEEFLTENKVVLEAKAEIIIYGILQEEEIETYKLVYKTENLELRDAQGKALWEEEVDPGYYVVNPKLCIGCRLCVSNCPTNAISMVKGKAVIDADKCIACGICANGDGKKWKGCPTSAISKFEE